MHACHNLGQRTRRCTQKWPSAATGAAVAQSRSHSVAEKILQLVAEFLFDQVAGLLLHLLPQFAFRQGLDVRPHGRAGHRASNRQRHFHRAERIETAAAARVDGPLPAGTLLTAATS